MAEEKNQKTNRQENQTQNKQFQGRIGTNRDIKRHTAYRLFIGMIIQGKADFQDERFLQVIVNNKEVVRVNIIANIIDKFMSEQKPYGALTMDDGTGTIRIKAFSDSINLIKDFEQGDSINVIGRLNYYNNEIYILPEIIKNSSITWMIARKLELEKEFGKDILKKLNEQQNLEQKSEQQNIQQKETKEQENAVEEKIEISGKEKDIEKNIEEKKSVLDIKNEILEKIKSAEPEGIDIDKIIMSMEKPVDEINTTITELLESGDVYEPKPGRLRVL